MSVKLTDSKLFVQKSQSSRKDFDGRGPQMTLSLVCRGRSFAEVQERSKCKIPLEKAHRSCFFPTFRNTVGFSSIPEYEVATMKPFQFQLTMS